MTDPAPGAIMRCVHPVNGLDPNHTFRVLRSVREWCGLVLVLHVQDIDTGMFMDKNGYFAWRFVVDNRK